MRWLESFLVGYPELSLYLCIGLGYAIGHVKIRGFGLGPVTGSLVAGMIVGQLAEVPVSDTAKSVLFLMFLFGIGYSVGPQFIGAVRGQGARVVLIGVFVPLVGLATAVIVARLLGLDPGFSAGLVSGGLTESGAIGTAAETIRGMPWPEADRQRYIAHIGVADAMCYVFGAIGVIVFCSQIGPRLLGIDVKVESAKLEAELGVKRTKAGLISAWRAFELRAYRVRPGGRVVGLTIAEAEARAAESRLFIAALRRDGEVIKASPEIVLAPGDVVAVSGRRETLVETVGPWADEVEDRELLDMPVAAFDVFVTGRAVIGRTLAELASDAGLARGLYVRSITRQKQDIPIAPSTTLERGDIVQLVGAEAVVERAAKRLGEVVRPSDVTDFAMMGLCIFLGGVVGVVVAVPVAGGHIALSTSVGVLLAGLTVGWLRSTRPLFARIPDGAVSFMQAIGLAGFVAMVGLHAGPIFVTAVKEAGIGLLIGGAIVTMVPQVAGLYFGCYVLKLNPIIVLGALAGAQTMTPALAALQERAESPIAVLGYTPAVPFGHILLTSWGTAIVWLVTI